MNEFRRGFLEGIPIGIGYLSVSFSFGILAIAYGFSWVEAVIISMTNLTSAGQFAGIGIMAAGGSYIEMLIAQITINLRYSLMSISLSQKVDSHFTGIYRWIFGAANTDEIYAMAINHEKQVSKKYYSGLCIAPYLGWSAGTFFGAILGTVIPDNVVSALGIALYGMFIAIVVPKMKGDKKVAIIVLVAILLSCCFAYIPMLQGVSVGFSVTICAVIASFLGAVFFPISNEKEENHKNSLISNEKEGSAS